MSEIQNTSNKVGPGGLSSSALSPSGLNDLENESVNIVSIENVSFGYGSKLVHDDLAIAIKRGSITTIMGPSGCGKSTVLSFIGGRVRPQKGKVEVSSQNVANLKNTALYELRKSMGMMFQHNALLTDLTVFENVAFPLREHTDKTEQEIADIVLDKLQHVGLREAASLYPEECSGGMQRRVALARAIVMEPALVMYDEPFTGLDPISKGIITQLIAEMNERLNITSIIVTHDVPEACEISDQIIILAGGKAIGQGTPEELMSSADPAIKQFMTGSPEGPVAYHYQAENSSSQDDLGYKDGGK